MRIPVFVSFWQIECCLPPPGIGDAVDWALQWHDDDGGPGSLTLPGRRAALRRPPDVGAGTVLSAGGVHAFWAGAPADSPELGRLTLEAHAGVPEDLPLTSGVVRRVQVVEQAYTRQALREWAPVPGDVRLRQVVRSPARSAAAPLADGGGRRESGALVELLRPG